MTRAFLDTNIVVYAVVSDDRRHEVAMSLLRSGAVISVQTLNEYANVLSRKLRWSWPEIAASLSKVRIGATRIMPLSVRTHSVGIRIAERYRLSVYDAMIVAAALMADCDTLYSEDMQHGLVIDGRLTIQNPFLTP